jgi:hypothetical protein
MRKGLVLILSLAFVAALPSMASAKKGKRMKHRAPVVQVDPNAGSGKFIAAGVRQFFLPLELTFGGR